MAHSIPADVVTLAEVVHLVDAGARVRCANDEDGEIRYGTARHFVTSPANFNVGTADLRDRLVRIPTNMGFDGISGLSD